MLTRRKLTRLRETRRRSRTPCDIHCWHIRPRLLRRGWRCCLCISKIRGDLATATPAPVVCGEPAPPEETMAGWLPVVTPTAWRGRRTRTRA